MIKFYKYIYGNTALLNAIDDVRPTLAAEKLALKHNVHLSIETVRKYMIEASLWIPGTQRLKRAYQPRYRRLCYGTYSN